MLKNIISKQSRLNSAKFMPIIKNYTKSPNPLGNATQNMVKQFGDTYNWVNNLVEAKVKAKRSSKPIMLIVHRKSCSACVKLGQKFSQDVNVQTLSQNFIMTNIPDDRDKKYAPDGHYVPRIIFILPDGTVLKNVTNPSIKEKEYKYFYGNTEDITASMKKVLQILHGVKLNIKE